MRSHKSGQTWRFDLALAAVGVALTLLVLGLGAWTRLADAGLGCPDWPGCYGFLSWPTTAEEIDVAEAKYPNWPYDIDRAIPEMVHRYAASSLGLLAIAILLLVSASKTYEFRTKVFAAIILVAVCLQGLLGYWTVSMRLWPQVVTAHLLGGMTILSLFWWYLRSGTKTFSTTHRTYSCIRTEAVGALILIGLQIALGGWVSSNYAALACPDLPLCQGQLLPKMNFAVGFNPFVQPLQEGVNYLGGQLDSASRTAIHFAHRVLALIVFAWGCGLLFSLAKKRLFILFVPLAITLFLQVTLGLLNVYSGLSLPIAVAHNIGAALLLLAVIEILIDQRRRQSV